MSYEPYTWKNGDVITAERMNALEQGVKNEQVGPQGEKGEPGPQGEQGPKGEPGESYVLPAATTNVLGGVKQASAVPEAAGDQVTKEEFKALLDALKTAGIMASS